MSEEVKEKAEEVKEVKVKETVEEEVKVEDKGVEKVERTKESKEGLGFSPFVTENDRFEIVVRCYKDQHKIIVEKIDPSFDDKREDIKEITFVFKHASQGDHNIISTQGGAIIDEDDVPNPNNLNKLEFARLLVLVRDWSLPEELSNSNMISLDPNIVKGVIFGLREEIGLDGIF